MHPAATVHRHRQAVALATLLLWTGSLFLPAAWFVPIYPDATIDPFAKSGLYFLIFGPIALLKGQPAWLANLLLPGVVLSLALQQRVPAWAAWTTALLPLVALADLGSVRQFDDGPCRLAGFALGYWLWCAAAALPLVARLTIDRRADP